MKIVLIRAEGLIAECGKSTEASSFLEADSILMEWGKTAPKEGGYDKVDFEIVDSFGAHEISYQGRYDLYANGVENDEGCKTPDLKRHIALHLELVLSYLEGSHPELAWRISPEKEGDRPTKQERIAEALRFKAWLGGKHE